MGSFFTMSLGPISTDVNIRTNSTGSSLMTSHRCSAASLLPDSLFKFNLAFSFLFSASFDLFLVAGAIIEDFICDHVFDT